MLVDLGELSAKISSLMLHRTQLTVLRSISTGLCPKYFEKGRTLLFGQEGLRFAEKVEEKY